jgi:hypothetical protein
MVTRDVNGYSPPRLSTGTWRQKGVDSNQEPRTLFSFDTLEMTLAPVGVVSPLMTFRSRH